MEFIKSSEISVRSNPGSESFRLLSPDNSSSERVSINRVRVKPGVTRRRHQHKQSEQIWIALEGSATLLIEDNSTMDFEAGDVVRFEIGDTHGVLNNSEQIFEYLAITSPPFAFPQKKN